MDLKGSILSEFKGKRSINGDVRQYWIEIAREERYDEIDHYRVTGFFADEPLSKYSGNYLLWNCFNFSYLK